ncbi:hypothetical protein MNBD_NITROSPINAE03-108 [hydrothermal vent metagenome]|uniref:Cytochrome c domain-containing protein n=1 Tax=hydrothermal vent metagenome TaxID=652676 RepID=A0A3B1CA31_9ZZZZ
MSRIVNVIIRAVSVTAIVLVTGILTTAAFAQSAKPEENAENVAAGKAVYDKTCVHCHGAVGKGDGSVAYFLSGNMAPHPRDFTAGVYRFKSTIAEELPTDGDLFRTITRGVPGFMPTYSGLAPQQRWQLVYYIKSLFPGFATAEPKPIELGTPVASSMTSISRGGILFEDLGCSGCHGANGMGDGELAADLEDDISFKIMPANLTMLNSLKNGSSKDDIYRTIMTGINGTPMPSFEDTVDSKDDAWHLVNFILSLSGSK